MAQREEVITRAIMVKLGNGHSIFDADDVLLAADIDEAKLKEIAEGITRAAVRASLYDNTKG